MCCGAGATGFGAGLGAGLGAGFGCACGLGAGFGCACGLGAGFCFGEAEVFASGLGGAGLAAIRLLLGLLGDDCTLPWPGVAGLTCPMLMLVDGFLGAGLTMTPLFCSSGGGGILGFLCAKVGNAAQKTRIKVRYFFILFSLLFKVYNSIVKEKLLKTNAFVRIFKMKKRFYCKYAKK